MMDLILRQARLMDGHLVDIGIVDGVITTMESHLPQKGRRELAVRGQLTLPAFVNGQLHACKSFWRRLLHTLPLEVQALPRFTAAKQVKQLYSGAGPTLFALSDNPETAKRIASAMQYAFEKHAGLSSRVHIAPVDTQGTRIVL